MNLMPDSEEPFDYNGPTIVSSVGWVYRNGFSGSDKPTHFRETINWREGKNLTAGEGRKRDAEGQIVVKVRCIQRQITKFPNAKFRSRT